MEDVVKQILSLLASRGLRAPVRLAIMLYLLPRGKAYFTDMLIDLNLSPGNLWSHLEKLRSEGYIETRYVFTNRPRVQIILTEKGAEITWSLLQSIKNYIDKIDRR